VVLFPLLEKGAVPMKILVACEYSGRVRSAFRELGHEAWSCDILSAEDKSEFHIQLDVTEVLNDGWDMMIAFPPCQFLANSGARWLYPNGTVDYERLRQMEEGRDFFLQLWQAPIPRIAIENPTPLKAAELPTYSQIIQPWQFGDPYTKRTLLWLKRLPQLLPTETVEPMKSWTLSKRQVKDRSRTFKGIAEAMAKQWSNPVTLEMFN
jgi:hypothetical protein